ncbi:MAG TPA: hypothetical protein VLL05_17320 [Terriglobales bacterium]|nr:hypothetical protein [Terriglobales bacterium]
MTGPRTTIAIRFLHWTVGLVVVLESCRTFLGAHAGLHTAGHAAALASVRLALSGAEIAAALLFLVPVTSLIGGYALLGIFALAIAIHALHGDFSGLEILVLYGAAVFVSLAERKDRVADPGSSQEIKSF